MTESASRPEAGATADMGLSIVARSVDITPRHPVVLASSPYPGLSRGVFEPLEANVLLLRQGPRKQLLVTLDLLYPGPWVREALETALATGHPADVIVGASHTHYAPSTLDDKPLLGRADPRYVDWLVDQLSEAVTELLRHPGQEPAAWSVATTQLDHSINRRRLTKHGVRMAPNPSGSRDEQATVLVIGPTHAPAAVIWNYACHPVSHPRADMVAAHFPGVVRERLREHWQDPRLPVLFFQGFSGDTRPAPTTRIRHPKDLAIRLRVGPGFYDMGMRTYRTWTSSMAAQVCELAQSALPAEVDSWSCDRIGRPLSEFVSGADPDKTVGFYRLELGSAVTVVGGAAEFVTGFSPILQDVNRGPSQLMRAGCLDDTFGYLVTPPMATEGGYEQSGFCRAFGYSGVTASSPQSAVEALRQLRPGT